MNPIYRIIDVDDRHAFLIGQVYQHEDGTYAAVWNLGYCNAGGLPMKSAAEAKTPGELVSRIRQDHPNALLCNVA